LPGCCKECGCTSSCNGEPEKKEIVIDFLYLDLSVCERCQGTENNLDEAIDEASNILKAAGYDIKLNKINIISKDLAMKYEFMSSPTIRVNGNDIAFELKESACKECGDLCGSSVECRVWNYEGKDYNYAPKELIINAILKEVYSNNDISHKKEEYKLPQNLEVFFEGSSKLK